MILLPCKPPECLVLPHRRDSFRPPNLRITGPPRLRLASQPNKGCTRATWPFFDNDCLWGNARPGSWFVMTKGTGGLHLKGASAE